MLSGNNKVRAFEDLIIKLRPIDQKEEWTKISLFLSLYMLYGTT